MDNILSNEFPVGMRILVVDEDVTWHRLLEQMLLRCMYNVTSCSQKSVASNFLQEKIGCFDLVLSDVKIHDMDGFKLLERVGMEMNLPVIMMSMDGRTEVVMQAIRHGACDFLIKPICEKQLKILWQHVVRKKLKENRENEISKRDHIANATSLNNNEEDSETESGTPSAAKKQRVAWTMELHKKFMSALNQLGINRLTPKRILELMNVPDLTRENVASHLQKYRLYLKSSNQDGILSQYSGHVEPSAHPSSFGVFDIPRPISYFSPGSMNSARQISIVARQVPLVPYTTGNTENMIKRNQAHDNGPVRSLGFSVVDPESSNERRV